MSCGRFRALLESDSGGFRRDFKRSQLSCRCPNRVPREPVFQRAVAGSSSPPPNTSISCMDCKRNPIFNEKFSICGSSLFG